MSVGLSAAFKNVAIRQMTSLREFAYLKSAVVIGVVTNP
jgi:hypothetical protein